LRIIIALLIIICLLSGCGFSATNERLENAVADEESESLTKLSEDSRDGNYDINAYEIYPFPCKVKKKIFLQLIGQNERKCSILGSENMNNLKIIVEFVERHKLLLIL